MPSSLDETSGAKQLASGQTHGNYREECKASCFGIALRCKQTQWAIWLTCPSNPEQAAEGKTLDSQAAIEQAFEQALAKRRK